MTRLSHASHAARIVGACALIALALAPAADVNAQAAWPNRPVRFYVAAAPGAAPDIIARLIADRLSAAVGQQVLIDNRPGGSGNIGTFAGAKAAPDGYNILFAQAAPIVMNQFLFKSLSYDPEKDLVPIVSLGISPMMIAVNPDLPVNTLPELVELARKEPGKFAFATPGSKNIPHLTGVLFAQRAGIDLFHVQYKTSPQASTDTIAGRTQIYIDGIPPMTAHLKSGRLRILAVSSPERLHNFGGLPTVADLLSGFSMVGWFALMAPAGTPDEVVRRLTAEVNTIVKIPEIATRLTAFGMYNSGGTTEALAQFLRSERVKWAETLKAARIEPE